MWAFEKVGDEEKKLFSKVENYIQNFGARWNRLHCGKAGKG
jgi:hypothetical protein